MGECIIVLPSGAGVGWIELDQQYPITLPAGYQLVDWENPLVFGSKIFFVLKNNLGRFLFSWDANSSEFKIIGSDHFQSQPGNLILVGNYIYFNGLDSNAKSSVFRYNLVNEKLDIFSDFQISQGFVQTQVKSQKGLLLTSSKTNNRIVELYLFYDDVLLP